MYDLYFRNGYSQLICLKCPSDMTKENLKKWCFNHAERVKKLPGLKLYTIFFTGEETFGYPKSFDVFEEMFFDTIDDLKESYSSIIWQNELMHMEDEYLYHPLYFQGVWLESNIVKMTNQKTEVPNRSGIIRLSSALKRHKHMTKKELKDWFHFHAKMALDQDGRITIPGIIGYTHSFAITSPYGPSLIDAISGNWWESLEKIKRDMSGSKMSSQLDHGKETWDYNDLNQVQMVCGEQIVVNTFK
jgi:hypothetical protein